MSKFLKGYNISKPEQFTNKNGETKTKWYTVGSLKQYDDGKMFIKMFHMSEDLVCFEIKKKEEEK